MSGDALDLRKIYDKVVDIDSTLCYLVRLFSNIEIRKGDDSRSQFVDMANLFEIICDITHEKICYGPFIRFALQHIKRHMENLLKGQKYTRTEAASDIEAIYERQVNFLLSDGKQDWLSTSSGPRPIDRKFPVLYSPFEWWQLLMLLQSRVIPELFAPLEMLTPFNSFIILPESRPYHVGVNVLDFKIYLHHNPEMYETDMRMQLDYEERNMHFYLDFASNTKFKRWQTDYNGQTIRHVKELLLRDIEQTMELIRGNLQRLDAYSAGLGYPITVQLSSHWPIAPARP